MTRIKYFSLTVYLIVLLAVTGCSSSINIKAGKDNTQDIFLSLDLGEAVSRTILSATKGMQKMSGKETNVFSKNHIESGLKKANVKNIIVSCPSSTKLNVNGTISSSQSHDLIAQDKNKLVVTLSPESLQNISKTLGEETRSFLDLFMAPVITGEKMTDEEYIDLLESVYGKEITNDIKKASIKFTMTVPDGCRQKSYKAPEGISVSATDKSVSFSYPLLRLLTLTGTETSFIQW